MLHQQILALSKQGMAAEAIAETLGLEVSVVKLELARKAAPREDWSEEEVQDLARGLLAIAKFDPDTGLRARVGMFIYEQRRGSAKLRQAPAVNIVQLNTMIEAAHKESLRILHEGLPNSIREGDQGPITSQESGDPSQDPGDREESPNGAS